MSFLHRRGTRPVGLLAAIALCIGALAVGSGAAAAQTLSVPLVPVPGISSTGGGSVSLTATGAVQISLSSARSGSSYSVSLCSNTGVAYSCTPSGTITTDFSGSFAGTVPASVTPLDLVLLVNSADPTDAYQALTGSVPNLPSDVTTLGLGGATGQPGSLGSATPPAVVISVPSTVAAPLPVTADGALLMPTMALGMLSSSCPAGTSGSAFVVTLPDGSSMTFMVCR